MIALQGGILVHPGHGHYELLASDYWHQLKEHPLVASFLLMREIRDFPTPYILLTSFDCVRYDNALEAIKQALGEAYGIHFTFQITTMEGKQGRVLSQVPFAKSTAG